MPIMQFSWIIPSFRRMHSVSVVHGAIVQTVDAAEWSKRSSGYGRRPVSIVHSVISYTTLLNFLTILIILLNHSDLFNERPRLFSNLRAVIRSSSARWLLFSLTIRTRTKASPSSSSKPSIRCSMRKRLFISSICLNSAWRIDELDFLSRMYTLITLKIVLDFRRTSAIRAS